MIASRIVLRYVLYALMIMTYEYANMFSFCDSLGE